MFIRQPSPGTAKYHSQRGLWRSCSSHAVQARGMADRSATRSAQRFITNQVISTRDEWRPKGVATVELSCLHAAQVRDMADGSATWIAKPSITNQAIGICIFDRVSALRTALEAAEDMREWVVQRQVLIPIHINIPGIYVLIKEPTQASTSACSTTPGISVLFEESSRQKALLARPSLEPLFELP